MEEEKTYGESSSQSEDIPENDVQTEAISSADRDVTESSVSAEQNVPSESESANEAEPVQEAKTSEYAQELEPEAPLEPLKGIDSKLAGIADMERRISSEVKEIHKLYHTEFAGRLKSMQDELEQYRKIDKGRAYDDILGALARIYGNNETLADEVDDPKAKKNIRYMLLDIEDLLGVYGMSKLRSSPGEKRNPRHCQILNRIHTDDPEKHDTVAKSYNSGFYMPMVLYIFRHDRRIQMLIFLLDERIFPLIRQDLVSPLPLKIKIRDSMLVSKLGQGMVRVLFISIKP